LTIDSSIEQVFRISLAETAMKGHLHVLLGLGVSCPGLAGVVQREVEIIRFHSPGILTADSLHNIHVEFLDNAFEGPLQLVYGKCDMQHH